MSSAEDNQSCANLSVLVVGATGATGKHVVQQLLDLGHKVSVIVRSSERMRELISTDKLENLSTTEASVLDLSDEELEAHVKGCDAVVSCLGHNMNFKGLFGHPRYLVTDVARRLTSAMSETSKGKSTKFILMNSDGVANPNGVDDIRPVPERVILSLLRFLLPPVRDNEAAAKLLHDVDRSQSFEWVAVRPTDLVDGDVTEYTFFDKPQGSLFGGGVATRSNVAKSMVDLITNDELWQQQKFQMPVLHDATKDSK